ncbi:MAG: tRNA dimethylallyltransferase [Nibricoccus sp.]
MCDSLLFYRGLDIGMAKPTKVELARVRHHLIDVCDISERMDVTVYVKQARARMKDIIGRGKRVVRGWRNGIYLKAFFGPVADDVTVAEELRSEIAGQLEQEWIERAGRGAVGVESGGLGNLDTANPRPVTRALERCRASGKTLKALGEEDLRPSPGRLRIFP